MPFLNTLWHQYYDTVDRWVRPWVQAHPISAYPGDGAETLVVAVGLAALVAWLDLWVLVVLLRLVRPRWVRWCTPRSRAARAVGVVLPVVAFFLLLEGVLRVYGTASPDCQWRPHPLYFWGLPRNATDVRLFYPTPIIHTNRSGFRGDDIPFEKEPGEIRVLITGDSNGFGQGVDQHDIYPVVLERLLAAHYRGRKITVINACTPGYSLSQSYYLFEEEGLRYSPDLVIVGSHKWWVSPQHLANRNRIAGNRVMRRLQVWAHESMLYLLVRKQVARLEGRTADLVEEESAPPSVQDDRYIEFYQRFLDIFRKRGMAAVYVAPLPQYPKRMDAWNTIKPFCDFARTVKPTDRVAFMEWIRDIPEEDFILSPRDHHFSARGHASIARQFYSVIVGNRLLD